MSTSGDAAAGCDVPDALVNLSVNWKPGERKITKFHCKACARADACQVEMNRQMKEEYDAEKMSTEEAPSRRRGCEVCNGEQYYAAENAKLLTELIRLRDENKAVHGSFDVVSSAYLELDQEVLKMRRDNGALKDMIKELEKEMEEFGQLSDLEHREKVDKLTSDLEEARGALKEASKRLAELGEFEMLREAGKATQRKSPQQLDNHHEYHHYCSFDDSAAAAASGAASDLPLP